MSWRRSDEVPTTGLSRRFASRQARASGLQEPIVPSEMDNRGVAVGVLGELLSPDRRTRK